MCVVIDDKNSYFEDEHDLVDAAHGSCNVAAVTEIKYLLHALSLSKTESNLPLSFIVDTTCIHKLTVFEWETYVLLKILYYLITNLVKTSHHNGKRIPITTR